MCYKPKFCLKNIVQKGKRFSRLPEAQIVAPDGKSCSKVTKHNLTCKQALLFGQAKWASRERAREGPRNAPCGLAASSRVLARLASLAQIGEPARKLSTIGESFSRVPPHWLGGGDVWHQLRQKKSHWDSFIKNSFHMSFPLSLVANYGVFKIRNWLIGESN